MLSSAVFNFQSKVQFELHPPMVPAGQMFLKEICIRGRRETQACSSQNYPHSFQPDTKHAIVLRDTAGCFPTISMWCGGSCPPPFQTLFPDMLAWAHRGCAPAPSTYNRIHPGTGSEHQWCEFCKLLIKVSHTRLSRADTLNSFLSCSQRFPSASMVHASTWHSPTFLNPGQLSTNSL